MRGLCSIVVLLSVFFSSDSAKILGVFPMAAHSHFTLGVTLMKELAARGHEVTFVNPYPQKTPIKNLKDVSVEAIIQSVTDHKKVLFDLHKFTFLEQAKNVIDMGLMFTSKVYKIDNFQNLLRSNETFDVIIVENFINEAFLGLGHHFKSPVILLAPGPMTYMNNYLVGNPSPSSYVPNIASTFSSDMTLWERMRNLFYDIAGESLLHFYSIPRHNKILHEALPNSPDLSEIMYDVSLILTTSHVSINSPAPALPAVKQIGGYHISKPKTLPKDLQDYLDNAKDGVVVFSLGSNLKSADLPESTKKAILNSFSKIKQRVLWKFEVDLPEKPKNVRILKWLPQNDVLAHPNVKLFISHGGLLSVIEAVYHGVPIFGIPVFWDQELNIKSAENNGFAINLPYNKLNEKEFSNALNEMLNNPKYIQNVKKRQSIMHDQPLKPMDAAVYWIEHVIRHKGADHLRSPGLKLRWYQRNMLDIILILTLITVILLVVFYIIIKRIINIFVIKKTVSKAKKNK